jgi:uncharacterized protein YqeY
LAPPDRISHDIKAALPARDAERLTTLRLVKSTIGYHQFEKQSEALPDAEVITISTPVARLLP